MKTKNTARFSLFTLILYAMLLSACSAAPAVGADNSNENGSPATPIIVDTGNSSNSNDVNSNDANSNDDNGTDANSNDNMGNDGNSNDSGVEIVSVVEAITDDTLSINKVTYQLACLQSSKISFSWRPGQGPCDLQFGRCIRHSSDRNIHWR